MSVYFLAGFFFLGVANAALPLPSYMKPPCARTDPNFNACALKKAKQVLPNLLNGDRKYNIPVLNPLHIVQLKVADDGPSQAGIKLILNDLDVYNISDAIADKVEFDFEKKKIHLDYTFPELLFLGKYDISGRILVLPITGKGDINITLVQDKLSVDVDYTLDPIDGKMHLKIKELKIDLKPSRFHMYLHNLFNGDKFLGKQMNEFLEENSADVFKELSPALFEAFSQVITSIINGITNSITYDTLFPEKLP